MDSKTRFLSALDHKKPDRVPFNFWMDRRLMAEYEKELGHRHWRVTHFGADVIESFHKLAFPLGPAEERDGTVWHTRPLFQSWDQADNIELPDPKDDMVYELLRADIEEFPDKAVLLNIITPWGVLAQMRTYELVYMDMYEYSEQFKKLSKRISDILKVVVEKACKMGVTAVYIQEDLASSQGLSMSPSMIKEFCLDYAEDFVSIAKSFDKPVLFHSDGAILDLIELLIDLGCDAVNPLQPNIVDASEFKKRYNNRIAVYGALDNCFIIPEGTPEQIREHVLNTFEILGKHDGSLVFSTHDIPYEVPRENIEALVSAIKECTY
jgi:uroporphyrinogen decarboxylase